MLRFRKSSVLFVLWGFVRGKGLLVFVFQSFVSFQNNSKDKYYANTIIQKCKNRENVLYTFRKAIMKG